jgi:hypothetical protein
MEVLIGIAEALSFVSFFALLVENLGGTTNCQRFMSYQGIYILSLSISNFY